MLPSASFRTRISDTTDQPAAFAECAAGRTLTVSFACREPLHAMNSCMKAHATQAEQDAAREEWFAMRLARQRERERKQLKKSAQEDFMREWWRMPERDEESRRKLAEKQALEERVGGARASHPSNERK